MAGKCIICESSKPKIIVSLKVSSFRDASNQRDDGFTRGGGTYFLLEGKAKKGHFHVKRGIGHMQKFLTSNQGLYAVSHCYVTLASPLKEKF